jgi:GNAT superfamily N-acetyltransferase
VSAFRYLSSNPPWPEGRQIAVVSSSAASFEWRSLVHDVALAAHPGGHSFSVAEHCPRDDGNALERKAFLYRQADGVGGYLCLADKIIRGYREDSARYREGVVAERVTKPCVLVVWVAVPLRRQGIARQLVDAAAQYSGVPPSDLAWTEPFTDRGYLLARSVAPDGFCVADYG